MTHTNSILLAAATVRTPGLGAPPEGGALNQPAELSAWAYGAERWERLDVEIGWDSNPERRTRNSTAALSEPSVLARARLGQPADHDFLIEFLRAGR